MFLIESSQQLLIPSLTGFDAEMISRMVVLLNINSLKVNGING